MDDVMRVHVLDREQDFQNESFDSCLGQQKTVLVLQVSFEVTSVTVLRHKAENPLLPVYQVPLLSANVRMSETFDHCAFVQLVVQISWI